MTRIISLILPIVLNLAGTLAPDCVFHPNLARFLAAPAKIVSMATSARDQLAFSVDASSKSGMDSSVDAKPGASTSAPRVTTADDTRDSSTAPGHDSSKGTKRDTSGKAKRSAETGPIPPADASRESSADEERDGSSNDEKPARHARPEDRSLLRASTPTVSLGGSEVVVPAGQRHPDNLVSIGGRVTIRGVVDGNVVVIGGILTISGSVRGDVVAVASRVHLDDGADIDGDMVNVAGRATREDGVRITGDFESIDYPNLGSLATGRGAVPYALFVTFCLALVVTAVRFLAVLVVSAVAAPRIEGALAAPLPSWILAFLLGLLVHLVTTLLIVILCISCIGSPVGAGLWVFLHIAEWMGLAAVYLHTGRRFSASTLGREFTYFGSILTGFLIFAIVGFIPLFGWILGGMVRVTALGLMLLTRFGGKASRRAAFPPPPPTPVAPVAPAAPPAPLV